MRQRWCYSHSEDTQALNLAGGKEDSLLLAGQLRSWGQCHKGNTWTLIENPLSAGNERSSFYNGLIIMQARV